MAKSKLNHTRTIVDKITVKGMLSDDGNMITYIDENGDDQDISIADCLSSFKGKDIDFSVSIKRDEELGLDFND